MSIDGLIATQVATELARFTELIQLRFRNGFYGDSNEFYSALGRLKLRSIAFGENVKVEWKLLSTLMSGSKRMKSLKVVILDDVRFMAKEDDSIAKDSNEQTDHNGKIQRMLDLARRVDVVVTGKRIDQFYDDNARQAGRALTVEQSMLEASRGGRW